MKYAVDSNQMKRIDNYTIQEMKVPGMVLMERAAEAVVTVMKKKIALSDRILVVCGPGNNGGDGIAAGRILLLQGYDVAILFLGEVDKATQALKDQFEIAVKMGIRIENSNKLPEYTIIIDAIFGVGLSREVSGEYEKLIIRINELNKTVFAVDIPSGISADTGRVMKVAIRAVETITFGYQKKGLLLYPGTEYAGKITVADIGFPEEAAGCADLNTFYYEQKDLQLLPHRINYSHKGTYGKVLVIAGSYGMSGAAYLSAKAAYRTGAGLVKILSCETNRTILQTLIPEAIFSAYNQVDLTTPEWQRKLEQELNWATVIVIGPGLGQNQLSKDLLDAVVKKAEVPLIIDADGINLLSKSPDLLLKDKTIITPHLMEFSRLSGHSIPDITHNLIDMVGHCSYNNKLIYAIKDARTICSYRDKIYINASGNHGMATGGSGDVLTGIIAALIAQGMDPFEATCLAVYLHGLAGDAAAEEKGAYSMMAGDILDGLVTVLKKALI